MSAYYTLKVLTSKILLNSLQNHEKTKRLFSKFTFQTELLHAVEACPGPITFWMNLDRRVYQKHYKLFYNTMYLLQCKLVATPIDANSKLKKAEKPSLDVHHELPYQELIGVLTYLSTTTRPDIAFAVSYLRQFNNCYGNAHWT